MFLELYDYFVFYGNRNSDMKIDNLVFRLHYKWTVYLLFLFSALMDIDEIMGDPIKCLAEDEVDLMMDYYCWIQSTFTLPFTADQKIGKHMAYPGVAPYSGDEVKFHSYYLWVPYVIILQAGIFYVPHFIWKFWEKKEIASLISDIKHTLNNKHFNEDAKINTIGNHFLERRPKFKFYLYRFVTCEILNLVNVILQVIFLDYFLNHQFITYGYKLIYYRYYSDKHEIDPMSNVFPKLTKCTYSEFGPSGTTKKIDGLCLMNLNVFYGQLFMLIWFWFFALIIITVIWIILEIPLLTVKRFRYLILRAQAKTSLSVTLKSVINEIGIAEWFFLHQSSKNIIKPTVLNSLIQGIEKKYCDKHSA